MSLRTATIRVEDRGQESTKKKKGISSFFRQRPRKRTFLFLSLIVVLMLTVMQMISPSIAADNDIKPLLSLATHNNEETRLCRDNQYEKSLSHPILDYVNLIDPWVEQKSQHLERLMNITDIHQHNWKRFGAFQVMGSCETNCIGGPCGDDKSKVACGIQKDSLEAPCVIYSMGGNNQWQFELDLLDVTPCEIHTFDCTGPISRFEKPDNDRLHFHHVCIGAQNMDAPDLTPEQKRRKGPKEVQGEFWTLEKAQQILQHSKIDLLKLDVEGWEWPLFESWPTLQDDKSSTTVLPMQILVEIHYQTFGDHNKASHFPRLAADMIDLQTRFLNMGYVVVNRDDNRRCKHCTELTLVRVRCS